MDVSNRIWVSKKNLDHVLLPIYSAQTPPGDDGTPKSLKSFRWYAVARTLGTTAIEDCCRNKRNGLGDLYSIH